MKNTDATIQARLQCRKKFLRFFPKGFADTKYYAWERGYKWNASVAWQEQLNKEEYERLLAKKKYDIIAQTAIRIETKTNLLFSFEKIALRDAVKETQGAKAFATGLYNYIHGTGDIRERFDQYAAILGALPVKQTRVRTWPLMTVFGFIADPVNQIFLKPRVTQAAAAAYHFPFEYTSKPNFDTYQSLLDFAEQVRKDNADLKPVDMIDLQSFIWVMGSGEYA